MASFPTPRSPASPPAGLFQDLREGARLPTFAQDAPQREGVAGVQGLGRRLWRGRFRRSFFRRAVFVPEDAVVIRSVRGVASAPTVVVRLERDVRRVNAVRRRRRGAGAGVDAVLDECRTRKRWLARRVAMRNMLCYLRSRASRARARHSLCQCDVACVCTLLLRVEAVCCGLELIDYSCGSGLNPSEPRCVSRARLRVALLSVEWVAIHL